MFVGLPWALQDASHNLPTEMSPDVIRHFPWEQNHPCQHVAGHVSESSHLRGDHLRCLHHRLRVAFEDVQGPTLLGYAENQLKLVLGRRICLNRRTMVGSLAAPRQLC